MPIVYTNPFIVGSTIICSISIYQNGLLYDPSTSVTISIIDPTGTPVVSNQVMIRDSVGVYHYNFQTTGIIVFGVYTVIYTATDGSTVSIQSDNFKLLNVNSFIGSNINL